LGAGSRGARIPGVRLIGPTPCHYGKRPGPDMTVGDRHLQRVDDQAGAHVLGQLPADDHPSGQVDHRGQIQPALTGAQVSDVPDQPLPGDLGGELSPPIKSGLVTRPSPAITVRL
jgi:hypothetical protein